MEDVVCKGNVGWERLLAMIVENYCWARTRVYRIEFTVLPEHVHIKHCQA